MGMKQLDCVHGVDRCISSKRNRMENKQSGDICSFVIIKAGDLKKLDKNIAFLCCS